MNRIPLPLIAGTGRRAGEFPSMQRSAEMDGHRPYEIETAEKLCMECFTGKDLQDRQMIGS
jgi:hypothetical protein